jgi:cell division protein FtsN
MRSWGMAMLADTAASASGSPAQELLWLWLILGAAFLLFTIIVAVARSIYLRTQQQKEVDRELLAEFQEAVERGEMSPEEFARVRRLLVGRLAGEPLPNRPPPRDASSEIREEDLPILEQETYSAPPAENAGPPQESERKTDSDSSSPESSGKDGI